MIAEDDPLIRGLFCKILQQRGYDTIEAINGEEAIQIYDNMHIKPDILVLDYRMPRVNGLEVTREILQRDPAMNILLLTGDPRITNNTISEYGIRYKSKPVKMDDFINEIQSIAQI